LRSSCFQLKRERERERERKRENPDVVKAFTNKSIIVDFSLNQEAF